eukprot:6176788-Pleurochrysis_carterae.AAC.2
MSLLPEQCDPARYITSPTRRLLKQKSESLGSDSFKAILTLASGMHAAQKGFGFVCCMYDSTEARWTTLRMTAARSRREPSISPTSN